MTDKWWLAGKDLGADAAINRGTRSATRIEAVPERTPGVPVVYFALAVGANLVKIGTVVDARRVQKRMELLQPGCPFDLKVMLVLPGFGRREEARLHRLYAAQALPAEWFRCDGELKELLQLGLVEGVEAAVAHLRSKRI